jgi:type I restriction enzyme, S subunit
MYRTSQRRPLDDLVDLGKERVSAQKDSTFPYIGLEHIAQGAPFLNGFATSSVSISTNSVFSAGDILFGKLRPNLRKSLQVDFKGYCSTDILVFKVKEDFHPGFVAKVFQSDQVFSAAVQTAIGTRMPRTSWDALRNLSVFVPSLPEQRRIAKILDAADETIRQTERVIAKLREVKRGLLHDLLTRGLDADGNLRDPVAHPEQFKNSPLGRIPREWWVNELGEFAYFEMGQSPSSTYVSEDEIGLPFLQGNAEFGEIYPVPDSFCSQPKKICETGDILISVRAPVGDLNKADQKYVIGRGLAAIRFIDMSSEFGWHFLNEQARGLTSVAQGTTFKAISKSDLKDLKVVLPSIAEQHRISTVLDAHDARIRAEEVVLAKRRQVKRGLMADLLTGRVRVRS